MKIVYVHSTFYELFTSSHLNSTFSRLLRSSDSPKLRTQQSPKTSSHRHLQFSPKSFTSHRKERSTIYSLHSSKTLNYRHLYTTTHPLSVLRLCHSHTFTPPYRRRRTQTYRHTAHTRHIIRHRVTYYGSTVPNGITVHDRYEAAFVGVRERERERAPARQSAPRAFMRVHTDTYTRAEPGRTRVRNDNNHRVTSSDTGVCIHEVRGIAAGAG